MMQGLVELKVKMLVKKKKMAKECKVLGECKTFARVQSFSNRDQRECNVSWENILLLRENANGF